MPTEAPLPPSPPDAGRTAALERALQRAVLDSVVPAARAVALLYLPFAATTWLVAPAPVAVPMTAIDLASALVLGLLDWRLRRAPIDPRLANPLAVVVASVVLLNSTSDQWLVPEAYLTTNFILLAIAAGYIILSPRYLAGLLAAILAAWGLVAYAALSFVPGARTAEWSQFGLSLLGAVALAAILHSGRVRTLRRLETLRVENEAAKEALQRHAAELERHARDLEQARRAAEEASRAKSAFVASMSHELRTPLNAILGFANLMRRRAGRDAEDREHLEIVSRAGEHLLGLINNVLSLAKIESGRMALDTAEFDLAEVVEAVAAMFRGRAAEKSLSFSVDAAGLPRSVRGDSGKLRQILINLLGNAFKFTDAGGVVLRASWRAGRAVFEVEDTGLGMRPDEVERLFVPFVQAEAGKRQPGTGLGLALSRSYAQLMDGELTVSSVAGRSSVFRVAVALPEGAAAERETRRGPIRRLAPGQRAIRVIVADDDANGRLLMRSLLGPIGFDVRTVSDGQQALEAWRDQRPDFMWMDMGMPVMDGMEATRRIRAEEGAAGRARTPIVALSATVLEHEREAVLAAGCDDFVAKPFAEAAVLGLMAQRLGLRYEYDEPAGAAVSPAGGEADERLTRERVGALPTDWRARFRTMVERGDSVEATRLIVEIEPLHATVSTTLRALLKDYRLAEIERLIAEPAAEERRPAASD